MNHKLSLNTASEYLNVPVEELAKLEEWEIWEAIDAVNSKHAEWWY